MKILHATAEFYPYIKMGGLSDMLSSVTKEQSKTHETSVALPLIANLKKEPKFTGRVFSCIDLKSIIGSDSSKILSTSRFLEAEEGNVKLYFFDSPLFRDLPKIYENSDEHFRFALFSYACFHLSLLLKVDVFHAHDWHTALGVYFHDSSVDGLPTVFTIHNLAYQGDHPEWLCGFLKGEPFYLNIDLLKHAGKLNFLKGAVSVATKVTTVSPGYRNEVLGEPQGCGLSVNLSTRREDFVGILNGLDEEEWNPSTDTNIYKNYNVKNYIENKLENKISIFKEIKRDINPNRPIIGMIGRLTWQKGYETFLASYRNKWYHPFFYIFLGSGDEKMENELFHHSHYAQDRLFFLKGYDEEFARKIEAASDFFLMPSLFEPCGLNQMYSHRYGTVPIVSRVGGLKDTVVEDPFDIENSTGIIFEPGESHSLDFALDRANTLFKDTERFKNMQKRIMNLDWSWKSRVGEYYRVYNSAIRKKKFTAE
ncbi:MAG: glycogen synthase [Leptospira sp.]|nr:glycogen synthase [Leptospira sp.]